MNLLQDGQLSDGGHPLELTRARVQRYMAELTAAGKEANTVRLRRAALRAFARSLVDEGKGATRWLWAGGSEGALMTMAGWSNRSLLDRYTSATASERAAEEARRLNLGEL